MSLKAIVGATVIDGTGGEPVADAVVLIENDRVRSVSRAADTVVPEQAEVIDAAGRYVIPGLLDANVHLFAGTVPDVLIEYAGRYAEFVEEAAQVTLRAGVTTVFDTWGPLRPTLAVRDAINRGETVGSRIYAGGNIIGLGGPLSADFFSPGDVLGKDTVERINQQWEEGVGDDLLWLTPEQVRLRVRDYIERSGVDFIKYAGSGHKEMQFIAFSEPAQRAIVEEGHRAGITVQAHTTTVESLRMEIEAGADLLQHGDVTGREAMPEETLKTIVDRMLPVAALVCTERYQAWVKENGGEILSIVHEKKDENDRRLIAAGARMLLTTDAFAWGPRVLNHPLLSRLLKSPDTPTQLGESHVYWLQGALERGMAPMEALLSATRYIAEAYHVADEVGTLEPGKRADLVILEADPLADVRNYTRIVDVIKDGAVVDRDALPLRPVLVEPGATAA